MPATLDIVDKAYPLWRRSDGLTKAQNFGWDNPVIQRAIGASLASTSIAKAVGDSNSVGPLLRDDIQAQLYQMFVHKFPLIELLRKREANGITDTYGRQVAFSQYDVNTPLTVAENGQFVEDRNTYIDDFANIALFGSIRGASLKSIFGSRAAGGPNVEGNEVEGGLLRIAQDFQSEALRMQNVTATGAGANTQLGVFDPTGFKGMRYVTEVYTPPENIRTIDVTAASGYDPKGYAVSHAIQDVAQNIMDAGGHVDLMLGSGIARTYPTREYEAKNTVAIQPMVEVKPGYTLGGITMGDGSVVPYYAIPGKTGVGQYSIGGVGTYIDIFLADSNGLEIVWLGSEGPTLVDIPMFADRTARSLKAVYWFASLEMATPLFLGKVRLKIA